jgi:hypothetical protein
MSPGLLFVAILLASPFLFYLFQVGRRKKGQLRFKLRRGIISSAAYLGGMVVWFQLGHPPLESIFVGFIFGLAVGFMFVRPPDRTRRIPKHVRRAVIERDLKGEPFDPNLHHLDHIIPFSRGGDHSVANLRVMNKTENMRRGARMPHWKELL